MMGMDQSFSFTRFGLLGSFLGGSFLGDFLGSNLFGSSLFGSGLFGNLFAFWGSSGLSGSSTSFDGLIALLEAIVSGLEGGVDGGGSSFAGRLSSLQGFSHSSGFLCHSINFKIRLYPDCSCITLIALTLNSNISSISSVQNYHPKPSSILLYKRIFLVSTMFTPNFQQQQQGCYNRNCPPFGSSLSQSQGRLQNNPFNHLQAPQNSFHFETQQNEPGRQARSAIFGWGQSFNLQNNPFRNANNEQGGNRQNQPSLPQQNDLSQNLNEAMNNNNEGLRRNLSQGNRGNSEGQQNQENQQGQQGQQNAQNNGQQPSQLARQNSFGQQNQSNPQLSESQRFWSQWGQPDPNITNRLFNNGTAQHIGLNPQSFQNGPPPLGLRRQGSMNMEQSNDLALEFERFNRFFNINPEVYSPRRNRPVQTDVKCKYCPKKANETSHMVCQDCVVQEQNQLRKFFQIKAQQMIEKDKESTEQIRKLKRQLANAQKDRNQLLINHEQKLNELRSKLAEQVAHNMELMEKVTKLKDIVKVEQNFREECKLLTEENNEGWTNIYQWAEKFNQFVKRVLVLLPKRGNQLSKHIIKSEQDMIFTIQHKLSQIPKEIISNIEQAQEEKTNELNCLKETQQQVVSLLQSQKAAFEKCDSAFPELTMNLAVEPFKNGISDLEKRINELEEVKSECTLFSIFSVDRNESAKTSQKYEEPKKMNQSEADVLDANDPNSPVGDGKREKESEE